MACREWCCTAPSWGWALQGTQPSSAPPARQHSSAWAGTACCPAARCRDSSAGSSSPLNQLQEAHPSNSASRRGPSPCPALVEEPNLAVRLTKPGGWRGVPLDHRLAGPPKGLAAAVGEQACSEKRPSASPGESKDARGGEQSSRPGLGGVNRPRTKKLWYLLRWQSWEQQLIQRAARGDRARPARPLATAHGPGEAGADGQALPRLFFYSTGGVMRSGGLRGIPARNVHAPRSR